MLSLLLFVVTVLGAEAYTMPVKEGKHYCTKNHREVVLRGSVLRDVPYEKKKLDCTRNNIFEILD